MLNYGCSVKIADNIAGHPDDSSAIEVQCEEVFKIKTFHAQLGEKLYPGGEVVMVETAIRAAISKNLQEQLEKHLQKTIYKFPLALFSVQLNVYDAGCLLPLRGLEKIALIKASTPEKKENILLNKLRVLDKVADQKMSIQNNFFLN